MANAKRYIGLSLGADLDWPLCFEEILRRLDLRISYGGETVGVEAERITIEPFDLHQPCKYQVVLDRLTHWYHTSREWIKKAVILDDLYVLNNPWSLQSMEKHSSYCAMIRLGLPVPRTWLVPPKAYTGHDDLRVTLERYAQLFDLSKIGEDIGYPLFIKPYDGGGWRGVSQIESAHELQVAYEQSGTLVMHLQESVADYDLFVRTIGVGPQVLAMRYDPGAPLHDRYKVDFEFLEPGQGKLLTQQMLTINSFFGWDFNSCESLRKDGVFHPIDFANACPDSQVTSLHFHFPTLVKALLRWSIFCAVTRRQMAQTLDWAPFYAVAAEADLSLEEKLERYAAIAHERFETEKFREFCAEHLTHLDEVTWEYFGSTHARDAVAAKVKALFPTHEHEQFTEHFWGLIQFWRKTEADRVGKAWPSRTEGPVPSRPPGRAGAGRSEVP